MEGVMWKFAKCNSGVPILFNEIDVISWLPKSEGLSSNFNFLKIRNNHHNFRLF
jgi:hypothetical protein